MSRAPRWTAASIGDQRGRVAVVTGANTGVGFDVARLLAEHGAHVVLACRDAAKAGAAAARIEATTPGAGLETLRLDLASLASVRDAAAELRGRHDRVDLLIANAAVMQPRRTLTADGFELHFGTNHLGHFAFTGLVLDRLLAAPGSRVVTVGSSAHRRAEIHLDDLTFEHGYRAFTAYARSKLAGVLCALALQRRLEAAGMPTIATIGDPGACRTEIMRSTRLRFAFRRSMTPLTSWVLRTPADGALGVLRAAVDPAVRGGDYVAPRGPFHLVGPPVVVEPASSTRDDAAQEAIWSVSEKLTGVTYDLGSPA